MRTSWPSLSVPGLADAIQSVKSLQIAAEGQALTVTRRASTGGGAVTTQTVTFIVQELEEEQAASMRAEGSVNVRVGDAKLFICDQSSDVREVVDTITYQGFTWRVLNSNVRQYAGTHIVRKCVGVREKIAS